MKKGTSIFLSICAGIAIVFGICGCLYGFNSKVHDWVNNQVGKGATTDSGLKISADPASAELKRVLVSDVPTANFVVTVEKDGKESIDSKIVLDVDNSKAGGSNIVVTADKAHTKVETDAASQFAGTYYLSGVTVTVTTSQEDLTKWSGYSLINFYLVANEKVSASFKVTYTLVKAADTSTSSSVASSSAAA